MKNIRSKKYLLNSVIWSIAFAGCVAAFSSHAIPTPCPITISGNIVVSVSDASQANCVITINGGSTLSTAGDSVSVSGAGSTVTNNGIITSTIGYGVDAAGASVGAITNTGTINTSGSSGIINTNTVTTINNSGTVTSTSSNGFNNYSGTVTNVINTGTMTGGGAGSGVSNGAMTLGTTITNFTNNGALVGGGNGYGVRNDATYGTIGTFNNGQGGNSLGATTTALVYYGKLPTNYNIIVTSPTHYGQLAATSPSGTTTFGVYSGGVSGVAASTLAAGTYASVLNGISAVNLYGSTSGTYGAFTWTLSNSSSTIWDLIVTTTPVPAPAPAPTPAPPAPPVRSNITSGTSATLSSVNTSYYPSLAGGTLVLVNGDMSSTAFSTTGSSTIQGPISGSATLSGVLSGSGGLTFTGNTILTGTNTYSGGTIVASGTLQGDTNSLQGSLLLLDSSEAVFSSTSFGFYKGIISGLGSVDVQGTGTVVLPGGNTYTGGTTVSSGTLVVTGTSATGTGDVIVASAGTLMGTGTIAGNMIVSGVIKPGNSPGYLSVGSNVTLNSGATYLQDIAGRAQASSSTPAGSTGYYSFLSVGGKYIINPGATLSPRLQNLFQNTESGYGSAPYVPVVGDKFRIVTANGGITGKFTTLTQPAGMSPATQFITFYNYNNSNSLDLAVIPTSFNTAVASSGNKNAQSVGSALDKMVVTNQSSTATTAQDALLYTASGQSLASLPSFTQGMAGEIYGATLAVVPQTSQRIQQAVISRLGDTMTAPMMAGTMAAGTNTAISATNPGGQPTASMSSNPNVNPYASGSGGMSMSNGAAWGEIAYQYGNRSSDSNSGGWTSNLVQAVVGVDMYSDGGTKAGGGVALSNTNVSASQGCGTVQQGSLFLYGKLPVQQFVVDAMASYGFNSTNNSRNDATGLTSGLTAKNVQGNDALVSLGLNLPIDLDNSRVTPYIRATWQQVNQNGFNEGTAASALTIKSFNNNGVRGVIGVAAGSKAVDPIKEQTTYRVNVGLGVDSTNVLNPQLNASLAGMTTTINTPSAGAAFVQAGMYGTVKFADNAFAYAGVTAEARSGQVLAGGNIGVRIQF